MTEIERQLAQALRETETERRAMRQMYITLQSEYEQARRESAQLAEQVTHLAEQVEGLSKQNRALSVQFTQYMQQASTSKS